FAASGEPFNPRRAAGRADRTRVKIRLVAVETPLDPQLASRAAIPERLGLRCRLGDCLPAPHPFRPSSGPNEGSTWLARLSRSHGRVPISRTTGSGLL